MPVTGPFAHFHASAASIRTKGTGLTDMVQPIETAEQAIAAGTPQPGTTCSACWSHR